MYILKEFADKKVVSLFGLSNLGLIIKSDSGVHYTNQTGGIGCYHPMVEGVLTMVGDGVGEADDILRKLEQYTLNFMELTGENADQIDNFLRDDRSTYFIRVDREMLKESMEAWIHVIVDEPQFYKDMPGKHVDGHIFGFGGCKGVLTWNNSD